MAPFVVTGGQGGQTEGAAAPNRLEIWDFVKDEKFFSLFTQALALMSAQSQDAPDQLSFFSIGGIHGLPYETWRDAGKKGEGAGNGYCTHGSTLSPTWHRPYVALYEQLLQRHAIAIAESYIHEQGSWKLAAANLRAPYWDWASQPLPPDEVIAMEYVVITVYDGSRKSVPNPLYRYLFHPVPDYFSSKNLDLRSYPTTVRHPDGDPTPVEALKTRLINTFPATQENTYKMLFFLDNWPDFSNHTSGTSPIANSLESVHDRIHGHIGGGGHMSYIAVADRMLSLWSAIHPGVWVTEGSSNGGSWTIPARSTVTANTNLTPSWNTTLTFWASAGVSSTIELGYTYPEFNKVDFGDRLAVRQNITEVVNRLYGEGTRISAPFSETTSLSSAEAVASDAPQDVAARLPISPTIGSDTIIPDWSVRVRVKKYELDTTFSVLVFLGEVPENPRDWFSSPSYIGDHTVFVNSAADGCENCRQQREAGVVTEGFVHLNRVIAARARDQVSSLGEEDIVPYLQQNLHWRVLRADGQEVPLTTETSLEITVFKADLKLEPFPGGQAHPTAGQPQYYKNVTLGRLGGSA